ncbi:MAG: flagellar biosynthetic protein FliR [Phycisphaeraceae bacterium]
MNPTLQNFLPFLPVWLMVLFRLTGLFVLAPLFGSASIPGRVRILWAVAMSLCIFPVLMSRPESSQLIQPMIDAPLSLWLLPAAIAMELAIGTLIGYGASMAMIGLQVAGHVADQQVGLGLAGVFNPELNAETGIIGEFYFIMGMMIFLMLGGDRMMLTTLLHSFDRVPLGSFAPDGYTLELLVGLLSSMFEMAIRVAAPLLCLIFLETVAMGFIARTVPQMNILSIGFPLRILLGIGILTASLSGHANVFTQTMYEHMIAVEHYFGR